MATLQDLKILEKSVETSDDRQVFTAKKWAEINSQNVNDGSFSNNQLRWDLSTLASLQNWTNLSEAYVTIPCRILLETVSRTGTIINTGDGVKPELQQIFSMKNDFCNWIDDIQLTLDNKTLHSKQSLINVPTIFKKLSTLSYNDYIKNQDCSGFVMDDYELPDDDSIWYSHVSQLETYNGGSGIYRDIEGESYLVRGTTDRAKSNPGLAQRTKFVTTRGDGKDFASMIMKNPNSSGLPRSKAISFKDSTFVNNKNVAVSYFLAYVKISDLIDIPSVLMKNMKGFLEITVNSGSFTFNVAGNTGDSVAASITSLTFDSNRGTCPIALMDVHTLKPKTSDSSITYRCKYDVSGQDITDLLAAPYKQASLWVPYYETAPDVESMLAQEKSLSIQQVKYNTFDLKHETTQAFTITPGDANLSKLLVCAYSTKLTDGVVWKWQNGARYDGLKNPCDAVPGVVSMHSLRDVQVYVSNEPLFNQPLQRDQEFYEQLIKALGASGGSDPLNDTGLIAFDTFRTYFKFYYFDLSKMNTSDQGYSKSVRLQCRNDGLNDLRLVTFLYTDKHLTIKPDTTKITM